MAPGHKNGIMVHPIDNATLYVGFIVEYGNDEILPDVVNDRFKREVSAESTEEEARARLEPAKQEIEMLGYVTGPIEVKTHKEWVVEALGVDPEDYKEQEEEELQSQDSFDQEDLDE